MFWSFNKWENHVVRSHTDSLTLTEVPADLMPMSTKLGCLKHEYSGPIEIISLNKIIK